LWLAPLAFALVFGLPETGFAAVLGLALMIGTWEFRKLAALDTNPSGWALLLAQLAIFIVLFLNHSWVMDHAQTWLAFTVLAWLLMLLRLRGYRSGVMPDGSFRALGFVCALVSITGAWVALTLLRALDQGSWWILTLLLIIWAADIGAYFTGRSLGRHKLAVHLSPGKTIEGLAGGLVAAAIVGWLAVRLLPVEASGSPWWILLAILTAGISVGGDLFISLHKRTSGCKDSGKIFPGHGGVLDRLDSLLAGAPLFALGVMVLGSRA
jgi:phosphatidate cytidylyltransferase